MPFPPPPPPGPPPPPAFGSGAQRNTRGAADSDCRDVLLKSIRQGKTLKKTVTNDRSAPILGKVGNTVSSNSNSANSSPRNNNSYGSSSDGSRNGLGGLFAGGIPKLKPTGRGYSGSTPADSSTRNSGSDTTANSKPNLSSSQSQEPVRRHFPGDVKNRGPPPQPPPSAQKPSMPTSTSDSVLTGNSLASARTGTNNSYNISEQSNRSFLHGGGGGPPSLPSKPPVGGYGKPNLAPKPPGIAPNSTSVTSKPSPPPKKQVMNGAGGNTNRVPVTRAQSMRVPRSPPVAPPQGPPFPPSSKNLGNYRGGNSGLPSFHQSQDSLHHCRTNPPPPPRTATLPSNLNHHGMKPVAPQPPSTPPPPTPSSGYQRPGVAPPLRPPVARPPPPPSRPFGSAVNPPLCPPPPPPTTAPPPPPPHRTSPAPPPPSLQTRLAPAVPNSAPPPPPVRNTSIRNGGVSFYSELEAKFSEYFHSVHEFPPPQPFLGVCKVYNSRNVKQSAPYTAKQQAPQPPMHIQLSNKMYSSDTSNC